MQCPKIKKLIYIYIEKILALLTDRIIAISPFEKKSALKYKICKENKIVVINNGIDTKKYISNEYRLKKCELGIDDDTYVVGMVGRLSKQKAPDIFVKASELIEKEIEKVFFIIVGDGEEKLEIEKMINDRKLTEKFLVTGWIDNPYDYINLFDQALLLSRWEGFGLVLAEYMLMKKPIVATAVDAIPDLIEDKENGYLVEIDNYEMVANNVIALYKNEEERLRISENGFNKVNELYKIERVVSEHLVLYNDLL